MGLPTVAAEFRVLLRSLETDPGAFDWDEALKRVEARLGDLNSWSQDSGSGPQVEKVREAIPYVGKLLEALREKQPAEAIGHTAKVIEWLEGPDPAQEGEIDARGKAGHR
jgi:hypothetical protein